MFKAYKSLTGAAAKRFFTMLIGWLWQ